MERKRMKPVSLDAGSGGNYFKPSKLEFIKSGCVTFDCAIGGGWPLGRVANLVGDKSTGKTLCAIEACANFARQYPDGLIWYREAEAAFDEDYAEALGLPIDRVNFGEDGTNTIWETVEDIFEDLTLACKEAKESGKPGLYIIDSLDALSSRAEMDRKIDEGSYGMEKQKQLGQLFRRLVRQLKESRVHLFIISQVREKIGISFGDKYRRSGGKALDFYASQVVYLSHLKQIKKRVKGVERPIANRVKVKVQKNKIGAPFRECEFTLRFGYGIDELDACLEFLHEAGAIKQVEGYDANYQSRVEDMEPAAYRKEVIKLRKLVRLNWNTIEERFKPTRKKYA